MDAELLQTAYDKVKEELSYSYGEYRVLTIKNDELTKKIEDLKKVCEFLSNNNMKLMSELCVVGLSRARVISTLAEPVAWAERTMTSMDRAGALESTESNPAYSELFNKEESDET